MIITGNNIENVKSSRRKLIQPTEEVGSRLIRGNKPKYKVFNTRDVDCHHGKIMGVENYRFKRESHIPQCYSGSISFFDINLKILNTRLKKCNNSHYH